VTPPSDKPGLHAERTQLAWERTAVGFLAVGAVALLRHEGPLAEGRTVIVLASLLIALAVFGVGRTRTRHMGDSPQTAVRLIGAATICLAIMLVVMLLSYG
jgi:putative membrane protein